MVLGCRVSGFRVQGLGLLGFRAHRFLLQVFGFFLLCPVSAGPFVSGCREAG